MPETDREPEKRWALLPIPYFEDDAYIMRFPSREAAEIFRVQNMRRPEEWRPIELKARDRDVPHEPICAHCGSAWPCEHRRQEKEVKRALFYMERTCPRCERVVDNGQLAIVIRTKSGRTWFHGRKGKCRTAAYRMAEEHPDADIVREDVWA